MAYHVIIHKVKTLGFCCQFAYYKATLSLSGAEIGKELGVNRRTVNRWRIRCKSALPCSPQCIVIALPPSRPGPSQTETD